MRKPNVVLIVVDALRAKNVSCYGYEKQTTPNIDSLAKEGAIFTHCYSYSNSTSPSLPTILSGKYLSVETLTTLRKKSPSLFAEGLEGIKSLQPFLKSQGYVTINIDWLASYVRWGFDYSIDSLGTKVKIRNQLDSWAINNRWLNASLKFLRRRTRLPSLFYHKGDAATRHALEMMEKYKSQSFFILLHYLDVHTPYNPPKKYFQKFEKEDYNPEVEKIEDILNGIEAGWYKEFTRGWIKKSQGVKEILARYDGSLYYVDREIGKLIQRMRRLGILEDTLLIITADHGESLVEHGIYFDPHGLYDVSIHVPLIIHYPGRIPPTKRISALVQHIDLTPTILDLVGIDYSEHHFDGKSLVPFLKEDRSEQSLRPFICAEEARTARKFAIRTEGFKYIFSPSKEAATCNYCGKIHGDLEELYDLEKDPEEKFNIIDKKPEIGMKLRETLVNFIEEHKNK